MNAKILIVKFQLLLTKYLTRIFLILKRHKCIIDARLSFTLRNHANEVLIHRFSVKRLIEFLRIPLQNFVFFLIFFN